MAKYCHPDNLDAALSAISAATDMHACAGQPVDFADVAARTLSTTTLDPADFTIGEGLASGRRLTVAAKGGVAVTSPGLVDHVAIVDTANSKLLYVTTADNQEVTSGSFVDFPEWSIEIADPA